ncbi:MAG: hypothetical protein SPG09_00575, partial [Lachnospiraceae bacterium]|nr:hypothetical protein [bacterium]MDY5516104.1 hypothetical protein [Lachnospiraceae bacterium]
LLLCAAPRDSPGKHNRLAGLGDRGTCVLATTEKTLSLLLCAAPRDSPGKHNRLAGLGDRGTCVLAANNL